MGDTLAATMLASLRCSSLPATQVLRQHARKFCVEPRSFEPQVPPGLPADFTSLELLDSWSVSVDSKIIRLQLPEGVANLSALGAPSGVKVRRTIKGKLLDKSYSPVSGPDVLGYVDLLVKGYCREASEGLGGFLVDMQRGDTVDVKFKPRKLFSGEPFMHGMWDNLGLVGCGTGVAPLYQLALAILDPSHTPILTSASNNTKVWFVSAHRSEEEFLMADELDELEMEHPDRFIHTKVLSGENGRIGLQHLSAPYFPAPDAPNTRVVICGTDGFLETVSGGHVRVAVEGKKKLKKLQGPLEGYLRQVGFSKEQVTKL